MSLTFFTVRMASFLNSLTHCQQAELVNFASAAVFDALVVVLTMSRTGRLALQSREAEISGSLSFILARDGEWILSLTWCC